MESVNEHSVNSPFTRGDFTRGIPFYGTKGDFNFTVGRSKFTPGISIKQTPLTDMSIKGDPGYTQFDNDISKLKAYFKPGDRIRGLEVNSQAGRDRGKIIVGKLYKLQPDYSNHSIRVWIKDPKSLKLHEVYVESIERIYESFTHRALTFSQFIGS